MSFIVSWRYNDVIYTSGPFDTYVKAFIEQMRLEAFKINSTIHEVENDDDRNGETNTSNEGVRKV